MLSAAYTVTLHHPSLPHALCQIAEVQYRQALERALGGIEGVLQAWAAWQEAEHTQGSLSAETWKIARQWLIAAEHAREIALPRSADVADAYFEVQRAAAQTTADAASYSFRASDLPEPPFRQVRRS